MTHTVKHKVMRPVMRPMLALSLVSSIALSSLAATPAQASDAGKFVAGVFALGLLGVIIDDASRRRDGGRYYNGIPASKRLPDYCLKTFNTRYGTERLFTQSCLQDNFHYSNSIPHQCETTIRYRNGFNNLRVQAVYNSQCLEDWGYHTVRTH